MSFSSVVVLLVLLIIPFTIAAVRVHSDGCDFPAIYNFGDSNSDTGSVSAAFGRLPPPYGVSFFGQPSGRYSDGRAIVDFLAGGLGLPYLSAFLDSIGTSYRHGANFAASCASIEAATGRMIDSGISPLSLKSQLLQFDQFKNRTIELYRKGNKHGLPRPSDFSKALYMLDIGQNDLDFKLKTFTLDQVLESIPDLINQITLAIQYLYERGARAFWIHNTGPLGCLPIKVGSNSHEPERMDEIGCIKSFNQVSQEFNNQLKAKVFQLRSQFQDAAFTYVDIYTAKYSMIGNATKFGFVDPFGVCCKHTDNPYLFCSIVNTVNGAPVYATSCTNPREYISWDSVHYTEAANYWVASRILDGSFSDPPLPISKACQKGFAYGRDQL